MSPDFSNVYEDERRAASYSDLGFPGTYYLAYRDIPEIVERHVGGLRALDFGCGTGRSTRFLRELGFDVIGVDISASMLERARELDSEGDYRLVPDGALPGLELASFDNFVQQGIRALEQFAGGLAQLWVVENLRVFSPQFPGHKEG